jgi:hypothetical protein
MLGPNVQTETFKIYRNGRWSMKLRFKDRSTGAAINVTSWNFRGQLRKTPNSPTIAASFTFDKTAAATGEVAATIDPTVRRALTCGPYPTDPESQYWTDILADSGSGYMPVIEGPAIVSHGVTPDV